MSLDMLTDPPLDMFHQKSENPRSRPSKNLDLTRAATTSEEVCQTAHFAKGLPNKTTESSSAIPVQKTKVDHIV